MDYFGVGVHFHGPDNWQDSGVYKYYFFKKSIWFTLIFASCVQFYSWQKNIIWSFLSGLFFYPVSLSTHLYTLFCFLSYIPIPGLMSTILKHSQVKVLPFAYLFLEGREREASGFRGNECISAQGRSIVFHIVFHNRWYFSGWDSAPSLPLSPGETQGYKGHSTIP